METVFKSLLLLPTYVGSAYLSSLLTVPRPSYWLHFHETYHSSAVQPRLSTVSRLTLCPVTKEKNERPVQQGKGKM